MIALAETMVVMFPQAVGVAVMKIKSFGLMVDAMGTRVEIAMTGVGGKETRFEAVGTRVEIAMTLVGKTMTKMGQMMTAEGKPYIKNENYGK
ncbi:MAG: hypothetical protein LBR28_02730 [Bacteroidales bacterium]|jgi:hypothetical protein|nr:hypothetical protein [Bacteroidales bacterium]